MIHLDHAVQVASSTILHCHTCDYDLSEEEFEDYRGAIGPVQTDTDVRTLRYAMIQWAKSKVRADQPISFLERDGTKVDARYHPSKQAWAWMVLYDGHLERYETKADVLRMLDGAAAILVD